ncbi:Ring finger domain protein [Mycena indigotica]|uniref:RING-type E3 ubiquitin transferase n=1 Tax=Mycena indigotica TaxID=2126181 RepID=A0A8H6S1X2_9AGAR|nr:Ring finger domain protein [Mycena indigotica]KAF7290813.1 Ring finger domain protein [Mycena indigotica]
MARSTSRSPSPKRVKMDSPPVTNTHFAETEEQQPETKIEEEEDSDRCSICLQDIIDRTLVPICSHEFCFDCLLLWTDQSRRCPLCSQSVGDFLIHHIRSRFDYQKHFLAPLATSPRPIQTLPLRQLQRTRGPRRQYRERQWGIREPDENDEADRLDRSIVKRRWIYEHGLYAKHVASNSHTRYRPYPTPAQFTASHDTIARTIMFLRRELRVWVNLDVEFLTNFTISLMKAIDIRSESAVKLLAEFLDLDAPYVEGERHVNAEHFAHEVYSFVRSPYKDLFVYDDVVQYDVPATLPQPHTRRRRRWHSPSRSISPEQRRRRSRSHSFSESRSNSRTRYTNTSTSREDDIARPVDRSTSSNNVVEMAQGHDVKGKGKARLPSPSEGSVISLGSASPAPEPLLMSLQDGGDSRLHDEETRSRDLPNPTRFSKPSQPGSGPEKVLSFVGAAAALREENLTKESRDTNHSRSKEEISKGHVSGEPHLPSSAPVRKPPRVRHRSLLESVQAHLVARPADRTMQRSSAKMSRLRANSNETDNNEKDASSPPSLLLRMSDPSTGQPFVSQGSPIDGVTRPLTPAEIIDSSSHILGDMVRSRPRLSAPEMMALTTARQTRLGVPLPTAPQSSPPGKQGSVRDGSGGNMEVLLSSDGDKRRAELLQRLEEEKRRANRANGASASATMGFDGKDHVDTAAVEARLRKQAQLRVRLAAEKRRYNSL